jgi:hypothetical protein
MQLLHEEDSIDATIHFRIVRHLRVFTPDYFAGGGH